MCQYSCLGYALWLITHILCVFFSLSLILIIIGNKSAFSDSCDKNIWAPLYKEPLSPTTKETKKPLFLPVHVVSTNWDPTNWQHKNKEVAEELDGLDETVVAGVTNTNTTATKKNRKHSGSDYQKKKQPPKWAPKKFGKETFTASLAFPPCLSLPQAKTTGKNDLIHLSVKAYKDIQIFKRTERERELVMQAEVVSSENFDTMEKKVVILSLLYFIHWVVL